MDHETLRALDQLPSLIWIAGADAQLNYFNRSWLAFTGRTQQQELGQGWMQGVHPEDQGWVQQAFREAFVAQGPFEVKFRLRHRSGEYRWISCSSQPFEDEKGNFRGCLGSCIDETEQRRMEKAMRERETLFKGLFDFSPDAVIVVDHQGRILLINQQAQAMFAYEEGELVGKPIEVLVPDSSQDWHKQLVSGYMKSPRVRPLGLQLNLQGRRKDGVVFPVDINLGPLTMEGGMVVLATIRDITERRRAEDELRMYKENLEELVQARTQELQQEIALRQRAEAALHNYAARLRRSNQDLQDFASIVSHDLQEPLRKVLQFGGRLKAINGAALSEEGRDHLDRMQNAAARMQTLVNDLLTYSRVTTQAQPYAEIDLNQVVAGVLSDLEARIEETGAQIECVILPVIEAEPLQMRQLFQNLIGNALKFHRAGVAPIVKISMQEAAGASPSGSDAIQIQIADNGIGFEEEYLERIFQPFGRLHTRSEYEGTGMGLAICRKIVERHHGSIRARSKLDEGSTFILILPKVQPEDEPGNILRE